MSPDTSSFPAYLRSLNLTTPVTTRPGRMIPGPPAPLFELALRLGLGLFILDSPRNLAVMEKVGIRPEDTRRVARRMRSRRDWRTAWEEIAATHLTELEMARAQGDTARAIRAGQYALFLLNMATGGDHYYFHVPMAELRSAHVQTAQLHAQLRELTGERVERLEFTHPRGRTSGLLHLPPHAATNQRFPTLVTIHGVAGEKNAMDYFTGLFRQAGYATFCIDMPAHGENFDGPRMLPDEEAVGVAALAAVSAHPSVDPARVGLLGSSMGGFWALRVAAASALPKACLVFAPAFDIARDIDQAVPGIQDYIAHAIGARTLPELFEMAKPYHLRDILGHIQCPVGLVHGTRDSICSFSASYEIARRVRSPLTVMPLLGLDHEVANPSTPAIAGPGIEWLKDRL